MRAVTAKRPSRWTAMAGSLMVDEDEKKEDDLQLRGWTLILIDSGACMHVAPLNFADHVSLEQTPSIELRAANGGALVVLGLRKVALWV